MIQPARMESCIDRLDRRPAGLQAGIGFGAAVRRAIVDDPEDALNRTIRFLGHDVVDKPIKRRDAGTREG